VDDLALQAAAVRMRIGRIGGLVLGRPASMFVRGIRGGSDDSPIPAPGSRSLDSPMPAGGMAGGRVPPFSTTPAPVGHGLPHGSE
jgi:hypothetical protein